MSRVTILYHPPKRKTTTKNTVIPEDTKSLQDLISYTRASQYYHGDKSAEFEQALELGRYPRLLTPDIDMRYMRDISWGLQNEIREASSTFAKAMCKILQKHHWQMKEMEEWQVDIHIKTTKEQYPQEQTHKAIIKSAEQIALDKKIAYRTNRDASHVGNKRARRSWYNYWTTIW